MSTVIVTVGTEKGAFFYRSDAARRQWSLEGPILKGWDVSHIAIDQRGGDTKLLAAVGHFVYGPTVQISRDWGKTWTAAAQSPKYSGEVDYKLTRIWSIVPGPVDQPDLFYSGVADAGLFVSRDGGDHWEELPGVSHHPTRPEWMGGAGGLCCHSILYDPKNLNRLWVGISAVGVLYSEDGGQTFQTRNQGLTMVGVESTKYADVGTCVHCLISDPADPDRLFQQNHMGVHRSHDGGATWERTENGLPGQFGFPMLMHPRDPRTLFIIPEESGEYRFVHNGQLTVYRTSNAGDSWEPLRNGLPDHAYVGVLRQAFAADPLDPAGLYFGTTNGQVFHSHDNGDTWSQLPGILPRIKSVSAALAEG